MSIPGKQKERTTDRGEARSNSAPEATASRRNSSAVGWWLAPAVTLAFACAIVAKIIHHRSLDHKAAATIPSSGQPSKVLVQASTNPPPANQTETNKSSADPAELTVKLSAEASEFLQRGDFSQAARKYKEALEVNPSDEDLHYNLGITLARLGQIEEAKKHYEEALKIFPDYVEVHNNLGNLLLNENQLAGAIEHFNEAIRLKPDNPMGHNNLGTALGKQGKLNEAVAEFAEAIKLQPTYVEARVNLANGLISQGQFEKAIAELTEALRLQPNFPPALNALRRAREKQASSVVPR